MRVIPGLLAAAVLCCLAAPAAHAADSCANAQFRPGPAANLPDCRAWEQVSPADKNGNSVNPSLSMSVSADGGRALFNGTGDFGGIDGLPLQSTYVGRRESSWLTSPIDPALAPPSRFNTVATLGVSTDLTKALLISSRKLTSDGVEGASNMYIRDTTDRSLTLAFTTPGFTLTRDLLSYGGNNNFYATSPDLSRFAFRSTEQLTPDAPNLGANLYEWSAATGLQLASRLPSGAPAEYGSGASKPAAQDQYAISDDGRLMTMELRDANGNTFLYQRTPTGTRLIGRSDVTDPDEPVNTNGFYASPSGDRITFSAYGQLTDASDPSPSSNSIYRWDAASDKLTDLLKPLVAPGVSPSLSGAAVSVSPDGNTVWFISTGALTADATPGRAQLFVIDVAAQRLTRVAGFTDPVEEPSGAQYGFSRDGTKIAIRSFSKLTGYDNENASCFDVGFNLRGRCAQIFTYDAEQATPNLRCVSCGTGPQGRGNAALGQDVSLAGGFDPHPVTDDGRVYFDSPSRLDPADANGLSDVYEYAPGAGTRLLSSGTGETPATFGETSPSGDDIFFYTADPLVGGDTDAVSDLYTARVGGGIASQQSAPARTAAPCEGSACQGQAAAAVTLPRPGTPTFFGVPARPTFRVSGVSAAARRAAARSGRVPVSVRVGALGRVSARLRASIRGRTRTVASARANASKAGTVKLTLKLSAEARRELTRKRKLRLTLTVSYADRPSVTSSFTLTAARAVSSSKGGVK